jgi:glutathione synthase/RimK-type ligase-like ATP-grasp enzyme
LFKQFTAPVLKARFVRAEEWQLDRVSAIPASAADRIGFPCTVKQPNSSSSLGVFKAGDGETLRGHVDRLFEISDLVPVQEFLPTDRDWRVATLDRRALYASR